MKRKIITFVVAIMVLTMSFVYGVEDGSEVIGGDETTETEAEGADEYIDPEVLDRIHLMESKTAGTKEVPEGFDVKVAEALNVNNMPVDIMINGSYLKTDVEAMVINYRTYVPLRSILEAYHITDITYKGDYYKVEVIKGEDEFIFPLNQNVIYYNDEVIETDSPTLVVEGRTMIPVRFVSELLGLSVEWDATYYTVMISSDTMEINSERIDERAYSYDELTVFSKLVTKEAGSVSYETMHGVASVVMNQVAHPGLEETIYDVIYDVSGTKHFPPAHKAGFLETVPPYDCIRAVKMVLRGENSVGSCIYFNTSPFIGKTVYKVSDGVYFCY